MYKGFYYELALSALVAAHCLYVFVQWHRGEKRTPWKKMDAAFVIALLAVYAAAVAAGVVAVVPGDDPTVAKGFGALSILIAVWLDFKLSRACGK